MCLSEFNDISVNKSHVQNQVRTKRLMICRHLIECVTWPVKELGKYTENSNKHSISC